MTYWSDINIVQVIVLKNTFQYWSKSRSYFFEFLIYDKDDIIK